MTGLDGWRAHEKRADNSRIDGGNLHWRNLARKSGCKRWTELLDIGHDELIASHEDFTFFAIYSTDDFFCRLLRGDTASLPGIHLAMLLPVFLKRIL